MRWVSTPRIACIATMVIACGHAADDAATSPAEPRSTETTAGPTPNVRSSDPVVDAGAVDTLASSAKPDERSTFVPFDINQVLSTGQSLSVGWAGTPVLSTTQPFGNLMFASGVYGSAYGFHTLVPLVEDKRETMSSSFANLVSALSRSAAHDILVSVHGAGGTPYSGLKKGTEFYELGIQQAAAGHARAVELGKTHVVRAVTVVHGESDESEGNTHYADDMIEWQRDYEADVKAATGQTLPVPMLETQVSSVTDGIIAQQQLDAHVRAPGKVVLVGPKYHLPYADGVHLTNDGYRHMGEDYAKVYRRVVLEGKTWEPVRPRSITREGKTITIVFHVPSPPLAIDTTLVAAAPSLGFAFTDATDSPPDISRVSIVGPDTVRIELAREPASAGRLRYALTSDPPRGNLRDSDATPSRGGYALYDWCVQFDAPVP